MSKWTYVHGVVEADTFALTDAESLYLAQTVVDHLPRITGSEGCVQYYINLLRGHSASSNCDEFCKRSNLWNDEYFQLFTSQPIVLITMEGALMDREFNRTLLETTKALSRLSSRLYVRKCLVSVDDYEKSFVFNDPDWITGREITDWTTNLLRRSENK